jgi:hypothetical protein
MFTLPSPLQKVPENKKPAGAYRASGPMSAFEAKLYAHLIGRGVWP